MVELRHAQLLQTGEGEVDVGFRTCRPGDAKPCRALGRVVQQGGLADAGLAAQHQHLTLPRACSLEKAIKRLALVASAAQRLCLTAHHAHRRR
jgi:hypothetical protein